jgi:hypothetical protein
MQEKSGIYLNLDIRVIARKSNEKTGFWAQLLVSRSQFC